MARRPNFLFFITDQHRVDYLGCYGHPVLKTPHIDSIAARGTRFTRFYVATPVCMPNRATLMTGRMPSVHGVRSNGSPLPPTMTGGWRGRIHHVVAVPPDRTRFDVLGEEMRLVDMLRRDARR